MKEVQQVATHYVFISYSAGDQNKVVADAICAKLESRSIPCWIAPRDITPAKSFTEAIIEGIDKTSIFVLLFSRNSNKSPHIGREVGHAVSKGIPVIVFRIEEVDLDKSLEYFLRDMHWLDALVPPLNEHLEKLGDTVELLLGRGIGGYGPVVAETKFASKPAKSASTRLTGKSKMAPQIRRLSPSEMELPISRSSVASLLTGLIGFFTTELFIFGAVFSVLAIIFGGVGVYEVRNNTRRGASLAITGLAFGIICLGLSIPQVLEGLSPQPETTLHPIEATLLYRLLK